MVETSSRQESTGVVCGSQVRKGSQSTGENKVNPPERMLAMTGVEPGSWRTSSRSHLDPEEMQMYWNKCSNLSALFNKMQ